MPMILNSSRLHSRRRSSIGGSSSASSVNTRRRTSSTSDASSQQSMVADWFSVLSGNSSSVTLTMSQSVRNRQASVQSASSSLSSSGTSTPPGSSCNTRRCKSTPTLDDSWGQFVDTAEAEKELVRNSKVLSRKEAHRLPPGYHHTRHPTCWHDQWNRERGKRHRY